VDLLSGDAARCAEITTRLGAILKFIWLKLIHLWIFHHSMITSLKWSPLTHATPAIFTGRTAILTEHKKAVHRAQKAPDQVRHIFGYARRA